MDYLLDSLKHLCISQKPQDTSTLKLRVTVNDKVTEYQSKTNQDVIKLYYTFLNHLDKVPYNNEFPTKVELIGDDSKSYEFTTFKRIF